MATANKSKSVKSAEKKTSVNQIMVFKKQNYILLMVSLAIIILGFIVMGSGEGKPFDDPMKITVAPVIVLLGFALGVYSILHTSKSSENPEAGK